MVLNKKHLRLMCTPNSSTKIAREVSASTKMKVYIRIRPSNAREETAGCRDVIRVVDDRMLVFDPKENETPFFFHGAKQRLRDIAKKQNKEIPFAFDRVYGSENTNDDVFTNSICGIFGPLLDGYNCSVFVYGATGAGKTFTMLGSDEMPGIIYLTMRSLFEKIAEVEEKHFDIGISYLEVYNENVHDLLNPPSGPLHLREDPVNGVIVAGLKLVQIKDAEHLFELLRQGNANRTQHPTDANAESSRSHAVFQVFIKMKANNNSKVQLVKLSMIDLAGSERGAATNCKGLRFKEGANINKSLLALGNCINNLADGVRHIPYRDSKLTRLLKDSLGGNCQTVMIACVGPTVLSYEDTYNTLKYAARARTIKTKISKNVVSMSAHVSQYQVMLQEKEAKIIEIEKVLEEIKQENLELRRKDKLPKTGDLSSWTEKLIALFETKKEIHEKILKLESKEKITRWRIKYKHVNAEHVQALDNSDDEDANCLDTQVNRMESTLPGVHVKINELWKRKVMVDEQLSTLYGQMAEQNITEALMSECLIRENAISEMEANVQNEHLVKLLHLLYKTNTSQLDIISKMTEQYKQHHNLLRGSNKVTNSMAGERKDLKSMLKGKNTISWEISPTSEVRKRSDTLKRYAFLSIDLLHTIQEPCPLIIQDIENDILSEEPAGATSQNANALTNTTFIVVQPEQSAIAESNRTTVVEISQPTFTPKISKKESAKENIKLPRSLLKRRTVPLIPSRKSTVPIAPKFKIPKRPLTTSNQNSN